MQEEIRAYKFINDTKVDGLSYPPQFDYPQRISRYYNKGDVVQGKYNAAENSFIWDGGDGGTYVFINPETMLEKVTMTQATAQGNDSKALMKFLLVAAALAVVFHFSDKKSNKK
jgi:hypothetical protein